MPRHILLILVALLASPPAFALRCGDRLVNEGLEDFRVRERCGEPFWTDRYTAVEVLGAYGPLEQQRSVDYDVWYYNFGPRRLMQRLVFRDGVLVRDESLGYGVAEIGGDCNPNLRFDGLSSGELYARCGEPASRRSDTDAIVRRPAPGVERWREQRRETWIYDFGDGRLLRRIYLVDGRVTGSELVQR
jgi:hypothetical protein